MKNDAIDFELNQVKGTVGFRIAAKIFLQLVLTNILLTAILLSQIIK